MKGRGICVELVREGERTSGEWRQKNRVVRMSAAGVRAKRNRGCGMHRMTSTI